jgi:ABC-type nitrate/sulfonate/bicarbonate transport system substrate-binding protein
VTCGTEISVKSLAFKVVAIFSQDYSADALKSSHALMISQTDFARIKANAASNLPGQKVLVTPSSTAQMYAEYCLAGWNIKLEQMTVISREQVEIQKALGDRIANIAFVWSPFTYVAQNGPAKAKVLPCLNMPDIHIPTLVVARSDLLNESNPTQLDANRKRIGETVAKYLGAWAAAKQDAAKRLVKTYADDGVNVSESQAQEELSARQPPDLASQRALFGATPGGVPPFASDLDHIIDFMVESGTLKPAEKPKASDLIDPSILEFIAGNPSLTAKAKGEAN